MNYHNITKDDMNNGDGLRVVLWVAGCSHHCKGCHNPITWDETDGLLFDEAAKDEIFAELEKEYIEGITLSGGDPLFSGNRETITSLVKQIKKRFPKKTIWLYTGFLWEQISQLEVIPFLDVLVDGPFCLPQLDHTLHWKGSANQRVIDVQRSLQTGQVVLFCEDGEK